MEAGLELCDFGLELSRLRRVEQHVVVDIESGVYNLGEVARISVQEENKYRKIAGKVKKTQQEC